MNVDEIRDLLEKARRSIRSARIQLDAGDNDFAVSRAYFAMFYAASAALLAVGERRTKHSAVVAAFGHVLVRQGLLPATLHRSLQDTFDDRRMGDYGSTFPERQAVEARIAGASAFLDAVVTLMRTRGVEIPDPRARE